MALGHKKFCDSRRFFEGRLHHTRISNPPHVKLASVYVSRVFFTLEYFFKSFNRD
jgi:hypothetical protein